MSEILPSDLINKRRLIRTAEMQREIDRRLSQPKHLSGRPPTRPKSSVLSDTFRTGRHSSYHRQQAERP